MSISQKTLQHPVLTLIVFVLLGVMGLFTLQNVAISLFPDVDMPRIMVSTTYTNAGPESVESTVTKVLESSLVSVSGLKEMTSTSSEGSSRISLEFNYGTDLDVVTNDVRDKLDRVSDNLPDDASSPSIFKMDSDSMPIMRIAVRGNRSDDDLKQIADDNIVDVLEQAAGVAEASSSGGRDKIVRVELSQNRLQAYDLTLTDVYSALSKENLELGGGKISEGKKNYIIRTTGQYPDVPEINNTVIETVNGYDVKLSDIGRAFMGYEDKSSEVYINGEPGVYVAVTKQSGKNSVTVANAVYKKINEIQETLPSDVSLEIISDDTTSIRDTINTLVTSAYQGLLLAIVILFIFLQNFKSTIIIGISIPLSIIITLLCMNFAGITLNMMTLTGLILGVGMIVDASIVMIENIHVYRTRGAKPKVAAVLGSQEMMMSVISGNLTTICVFVPFLFFINDLEMMGQMFKGIIFTVVIALISSLFVAIFLVPVLAGVFLPLTNRKEHPVHNLFLKKLYDTLEAGMNKITAVYRRILKAALDNRAVTTIIVVSALVVAVAFIPTMRINMMPSGQDDSVTLNVTMPTGTKLSETTAVLKQFEKIVQNEIKGYTYLITSIGTGSRGYGTSATYKGSISIRLPDAADQIDNSDTIKQKLRAHFNDFADAEFDFDAGRAGQMTGDDLDIAIRSSDLDAALDVASKVKTVMENIPDIGEVSVDTEKGLPQVEIVIDRQRAYSFGVDVETVAKEINYAIDGVTSTTYRENGDDYDVDVMYQPSDRAKMADLENIYVQGSDGMVSVANFAQVRKGLGPVTIGRDNQARIVNVTANIISETNANVVEGEIKKGIANSFVVPDGVTVSYEGSWKDIQDQSHVYLLIIAMAIILVFGVMAATYESFKAPLINLTTIPFLIIGVVFLYKIIGQPLSMMSMVGLIMLVGIVVNNGIILVDYTNLLVDRGMKKKEACLEAGVSRLRPVLMTTLTTILGMLPMSFATEGSAAMVQPISLAVIGGLTSSTFITLLFIPVLYSLVMHEKKSAAGTLRIDVKPELPEESSGETAAEKKRLRDRIEQKDVIAAANDAEEKENGEKAVRRAEKAAEKAERAALRAQKSAEKASKKAKKVQKALKNDAGGGEKDDV